MEQCRNRVKVRNEKAARSTKRTVLVHKVRRMPEALLCTPEMQASRSLISEVQIENLPKQQAEEMQQTKSSPREPIPEIGSEFTFHPRVSTASSKMVENLGMNFLARQQRHMERQKKLYEENQNLHNSPYNQNQESKRPKISTSLTKSYERPSTGGSNLLKKRHRLPRNQLKKRSTVNSEDMESSPHSPVPPSSSPLGLPPRSKTYYPSQTLPLSCVSNNVKKKNASDPYANFDRLQKAKLIAEKAIKSKKVFSIHGPYPLIRRALRDRGWVEKEFKLPVRARTNKPSGDSSDADDIDDDDDDDDVNNHKDSGIGVSPRPPFESSENAAENDMNDCYGIMGRMVRNETSMFQWTTRTGAVDWRFLQKDQIVNHFSKANFTTKVGLCVNLRMLSCFAVGHSDTFFPRCYRLSNEDDKLDFIDDFRLGAASGILKMVVGRHVDDSYGKDAEKIENGQLPPSNGSHVVPNEVLLFAIRVCDLYVQERDHDDIDMDDASLYTSEDDWEKLLHHYYKLVHEGAVIAHSCSYLQQCEQTLARLKERNPQFFTEGVKNTWIIKPGAKSRGRGIIVINRLEEILKLVAGDATLIKDSRWVVQKYIERPLLIHGTKFDIRQWFLVSDWNPLTVWIYKECYLRFSSRPFSLKNLDPSIHLCNYSVQKNVDMDVNRNPLLPVENMWSCTEFKTYLRSRDCHTLWDDLVFPGMKKAIIHICQTAQDVVEYRKGSFELYGADFMLDENYNPWLIEVNSSPTMSRSTAVTSRLCAAVQEDTMKVILDRKRDRNCDIGLFELIYKQPVVDVPLYVGKALNVEGVIIRKPTVPVRRSFNNNNNTNLTNNQPNNNTSESETPPIGGSRVPKRTAGVYAAARPSRVTVRTTNQARNTTQTNFDHNEHNNHSGRVTTDRSRSPVKIKMQSTLKRLNNEAHNIPTKPNAFNLPKCSPSNTSIGSSGTASTASQASVPRVPSYGCKQPAYSIKLPTGPDAQHAAPGNGNTHFVSSSQAKAASSMGIMHLGSAYSSMIAAANRGCLPGKFNHIPFPPPQAVVPKTFPSSIPAGEIAPGGGTYTHPTPPTGVVAVTPQNLGLSLPFQKFFHAQAEQYLAQQQGRRGPNYPPPQEFRLGGSRRQHVSGCIKAKSECVVCGMSDCASMTNESSRDSGTVRNSSPVPGSRHASPRNRNHVTCRCATYRNVISDDFLTNSVNCVGDPPPMAVRSST
nr:tubulin monoglycylase TTLL3 isoform X2 [Ciona intestinalis]|eukprot:XP_009861473.2 tubulin monoglycylase TTLL3 isoform X2 [Ciona intestinalis]